MCFSVSLLPNVGRLLKCKLNALQAIRYFCLYIHILEKTVGNKDCEDWQNPSLYMIDKDNL